MRTSAASTSNVVFDLRFSFCSSVGSESRPRLLVAALSM